MIDVRYAPIATKFRIQRNDAMCELRTCDARWSIVQSLNSDAWNVAFLDMADWLTRTVRTAGIERVLKAGQVLFRAGERTTGLFEVKSGSVRLVRVDRNGRETVLYVALPGETLAEASLFAPVYHCDATAVTDAVVLLYPTDKVLGEFDRNSAASQAFMAMLAQQVMNLRSRLEQRNIHSAHDRVLHHLALNVGADGCTVKISGTLKDLSAELGLTHEALYRTLADMATAGEIERLKGKIKLVRPSSSA